MNGVENAWRTDGPPCLLIRCEGRSLDGVLPVDRVKEFDLRFQCPLIR